MLGKLIKHDFKATYRFQCGMYLVVLIMTLIALFVKIGLDAFPMNAVLLLFKPLSSGIAILCRVALFIVTVVWAVLRYRKNILKDEGYLMHTLPVKEWQLLFSKLAVPYIWMLVNAVFVYLTVALENRDIHVIDWSVFSDSGIDFGFSVIFLVVVTLLLSLLTMFSNFYVSLNIGYTFSKDKDLMSFVAYVVIYLINQGVSMVVMVLFMLINWGNFSNMAEMDVFPVDYFTGVFTMSIVMSIVICAVYNGVSIYVLNKKLNLE